MTSYIVVLPLLAGIVSLASPIFWKRILIAMGAFDEPNHRSSHSSVTLRGGGIGALTGAVFILVCMIVFYSEEETFIKSGLVLGAGILVAILGLCEDVFGVKPSIRALIQALIGVLIGLALWIIFDINFLWIPFFALFFSANVNFTNFMDGVNGISSFHAIVAGSAYVGIGIYLKQEWLVISGLSVALLFAAFLPWNLIPPHIFMGDVGSYLLGGLTAATVIIGAFSGINIIGLIAPLSIYWADTISTLMKRAFKHLPLFEAHRMHVYQRVTDYGFSHLKVASGVGFFTILSSVAGFISLNESHLNSFVSVVLLAIIVLIYLQSPKILSKRRAGL